MCHKIVFLVFLVGMVFVSECKKTENPADIPANEESLPNFAGDWILEWEESEILFQINSDSKLVILSDQVRYPYHLDSIGVRIQASDEETLKGYFLFSDHKEKTWLGTWEDRVVRLRRKLP